MPSTPNRPQRRLIPAATLAAIVCLAIGAAYRAPPAPIALYYSPRGGCATAITNEIDHATATVDIAAYSLTSKPIADALLRAATRGLQVRLVVDRRQPTAHHGQYPRLATSTIHARIDRKHPLMHQKLLIIDNATTILGSYNFTANAENHNAEILCIIRDPATAHTATEHFTALFKQSAPNSPCATSKPHPSNSCHKE